MERRRIRWNVVTSQVYTLALRKPGQQGQPAMVLDAFSATRAVVRFGTFEADLRAGELHKRGVKVRIQEQPFQVLKALLQRPGELVTREELRSQLWRRDTFVDFDNGLNTSINKLREALGDSADNPRFVETVPRRGYRFIAPVAADHGETPSIAAGAAPHRWTRTILIVAAVFVVAAALGIAYLQRDRRPPGLTEKDTIVLADFTNTTGDRVFDGTLRQGLAVELEQSPYLSLVPEGEIQQTLRMMKRPADSTITSELAREICQRTRTTIVLDGSIAQVGTQYTVILRATNCSNGQALTSTEARAPDKNRVLDALGRASSDMRRRLGESLATVQRFDTPLVQASTPSLEALQFYSLGYRALIGKGDSAAAIPFFREAVKHDPNFAMAYALLGNASWNVGENTAASDNIRKAYDLRSSVSESERLRIESAYDSLGTADLEKAKTDFEVWVQTYPRDCGPRNQIGVIHSVLGHYDLARSVFVDALGLCPQSGLIRGNLITSLISLNRLRDAHAALDEATRRNPDSPGVRINSYRLAFLEHDTEGMQQQLALSAGVPGLEDELLWFKSATASYYGQWTNARAFHRQAVDSTERAGEVENAASYEADAALRAALVDFRTDALHRARSALLRSTGPQVLFRGGLALAIVGDLAAARTAADELSHRFPADTIVQSVYVPTLRAQLALSGRDARKALELLEPVIPYERGSALYPAYVRGLALLVERRASDAATEFEKITSNRGIVLTSVIGTLAHLQTGRAHAIAHDLAQARAAYERFFDLWKDADPDVPVLRHARSEYDKLRSR